MTQLTEKDLIQIRRKLHQIPELALKEKQTQKLLLTAIQDMPQDYLTVKTFPELPTAIMVHVEGKQPQKPLATGQILTDCQSRKTPGFPIRQLIPVSCMHAGMTCT